MLWLTSTDTRASMLPAAWLIPTSERPANLAERARLRRNVAGLVLDHQLGQPHAAIEIGHDKRGRPHLVHPAGHGLHLSLATRSGMVAVGLAERPIGIDVERVEQGTEPPLAVLHPSERDILLALPAAERPLAFAQLWSAKEAYVKALGTGFAHAPERFCVRFLAEGFFTIEDAGAPSIGIGAARLMKNGDQEDLAAAIVVLA
ncbi:4'-phosphopantetheinyl transferase [Bosea sp. LC85]|uniref:4'-phosphopantetheinyl transferase superfamily protein n=1 Tax=Bosea sp. LC85 TaxID=1502851 RepID=UPI0004E34266|nr:4'-phosphopantetheinyl transferase superfamily protein [Bosea sp. LC85]KFC74209.1 4'-phosphopantetheinyl transferase [Bosea sp. LC85]